MNPRMKKLTLALVQAMGAGVAVSLAATPVLAQQTQKIEKIEVRNAMDFQVTEQGGRTCRRSDHRIWGADAK